MPTTNHHAILYFNRIIILSSGSTAQFRAWKTSAMLLHYFLSSTLTLLPSIPRVVGIKKIFSNTELNHSKLDTIKQEINWLHENLYTKFERYNSIKQEKNSKNLCSQNQWTMVHSTTNQSMHKTFILHNLTEFNTPVKPISVNKNVSLERVINELLYLQNAKQLSKFNQLTILKCKPTCSEYY
jgi:hypothetical protein